MLHKVNLQTSKHAQMIDITRQIQEAVKQENISDGTVLVFCPHTTSAITINENADPDVIYDILKRLEDMYPWNQPLDRHSEGNSAAHLKASTIGASELIPVTEGRLLLGTWQGIFFCEFDGPRSRTFYVKVYEDNRR